MDEESKYVNAFLDEIIKYAKKVERGIVAKRSQLSVLAKSETEVRCLERGRDKVARAIGLMTELKEGERHEDTKGSRGRGR